MALSAEGEELRERMLRRLYRPPAVLSEPSPGEPAALHRVATRLASPADQ